MTHPKFKCSVKIEIHHHGIHIMNVNFQRSVKSMSLAISLITTEETSVKLNLVDNASSGPAKLLIGKYNIEYGILYIIYNILFERSSFST